MSRSPASASVITYAVLEEMDFKILTIHKVRPYVGGLILEANAQLRSRLMEWYERM
jgi:hypothetical protein